MLNRLFGLLEIDYPQWRALTRAVIRRDFRESSMSTTLSHGRTGRRVFITLIFFYFLTGMIFVPIVLSIEDLFVSVTFLMTYTMFLIGGLILIEYNTVVLSPEDYQVLGYHPISSRTFFVVKLTNVLFYVLTFSTILALPSLSAYFFDAGFRPAVGLVAFVSLVAGNFTVALAVVLLYAVLLKKVNMQRFQNFLALFQVGMAFLIYTSFFIVPKMVEGVAYGSMDFQNTRWLYFLPSTWFSSFIRIASGRGDPLSFMLAALALLSLLSLSYLATSKLSLTFTENLTSISTRSDIKRTKRRFKTLFSLFAHSHEERVVAKLIRNQFLYDNKFKMAVLGILPLTVFYLFVGLEQGPLPDPFVTHLFEMKRSGLLYLLIFLFPMMLRTFVTQSDSFQASWVFYSAPTDFKRVIMAEKNFLMIYFVLPFLMLLGLVFYSYFDHLLHVLLHILVLGLLSHLFLQFAFLYSPDLPFSRPNVKGSRSKNMAMFLIVIPFVIYLLLPIIFEYIYPTPASFITFSATILIVAWLLEKLIGLRLSAYMRKYEFPG